MRRLAITSRSVEEVPHPSQGVFYRTAHLLQTSGDRMGRHRKGNKRRYRQNRYNRFMKSLVWRLLRREALERADRKCALCESGNQLEVHHTTYVRFGGRELPEDLRVLCRSCHRTIHAQKKLRPVIPLDAATRKLRRERIEAKLKAAQTAPVRVGRRLIRLADGSLVSPAQITEGVI